MKNPLILWQAFFPFLHPLAAGSGVFLTPQTDRHTESMRMLLSDLIGFASLKCSMFANSINQLL